MKKMAARPLFPLIQKQFPRFYDCLFRIKLFFSSSIFVLSNLRYVKPSDYFATEKVKEEYLIEVERLSKVNLKELTYPMDFNFSKKAGLVLYSIVRKFRPESVLETGVANGFSTRMILRALEKNRSGTLVSVDIKDNVGGLLHDIPRKRWDLRIGVPGKIFSSTVSKMQQIDLFVHDSDHSYANMTFELAKVLPRLNKNAVIVMDDVNVNPAFLELARNSKVVPFLFVSWTKSVGVVLVRKSS